MLLRPSEDWRSRIPAGNLYGTAAGSIFKILPNGTNNWYLTNILVFSNSALQGSMPNGTPILDSAGNVYGTTTYGGKNNLGAIYGLVKKGPLKYTEKLLYKSWRNTKSAAAWWVGDGFNRKLCRTTSAGGKNGAGGGVMSDLVGTQLCRRRYPCSYLLERTGAVPYDSLVLDSANYLYGTTYYGGTTGHGTVFIANPHAAISSITLTSSVNPVRQRSGRDLHRDGNFLAQVRHRMAKSWSSSQSVSQR